MTTITIPVDSLADIAETNMDHGSRLMTASYALETLGDLLGCDGADHGFGERTLMGLAHAVQAVGFVVRDIGGALVEHAESLSDQGVDHA